MTKIKICGLKRPEDVAYVNAFLPDYAGFVFAGTKRKIDDALAKTLKAGLDARIPAVGVFVNEDIRHVAQLANEGIIDLIQLHGNENQEYIDTLRKMTKCEIIKAVRVKDAETVLQAKKLGADYLLLDTYVSKEEYGGTGKTFDRTLIPEDIGNYFLAGGLGADNLAQALSECHPYAVDLSSSVETNGVKDREKIKEVIEIVRNS